MLKSSQPLLISLFFMTTTLLAEPIVMDPRGALVWQDNKESTSKQRSWDEAQDYCKKLTLAGSTNWRTPSLKELKYALKNISFTHGNSESFWTNSQFVYLPFDPLKAKSTPNNDLCCSDSKAFTRCVRNH